MWIAGEAQREAGVDGKTTTIGGTAYLVLCAKVVDFGSGGTPLKNLRNSTASTRDSLCSFFMLLALEEH